ncbi:anti-sigma factor antagonist [Streptomyces sp. NPDC059340]|uniref:anti-sigma factor antagonist n=1 Tax=Streptomyces sp. NPDC059340 TaxID=3346806 RepID=UPI0036A236BB
MTIEWRYTVEQNLGVLSVSGYLGPDAVRRCAGAVGWVVGRGTGPVIVRPTGLRGWSVEGQPAIRGLPARPRPRRPGRRARHTQHTARPAAAAWGRGGAGVGGSPCRTTDLGQDHLHG